MWERRVPPSSRHYFRHRRPDWWPENEPWPPPRPSWRSRPARFFRRIGCLLALVNLLVLFIFSIIVVLVANGLGYIHLPRSSGWFIPVGILLFIFGIGSLVLTGRSLQRMSAPLGDLVEAAGRITQGDYSPRVPVRGSSELRSLARAFNEMAARLQLTEAQRRDLMADITHELRTPITIIQGTLEGMVDGVYAADGSHLKSVLEETQILSRLVDDLRTLALAESGALQLKKEPTDLAVLIGETASAFRAQADAAGVVLEIQPGNGIPLISLDPERIRQVLDNLIANALRYTARGGFVRIRCEKGSSEAGKSLLVTVEDNGTGIAPDVLPNVFDRFVKSRDSSGTGLGLPIARHLVEAHGGTITAESRVGQGTIFRITLPLAD
jgi:two-component system sensor histidine kinase BaeS